MYSSAASPSRMAVKRLTAGGPALRYTRDAAAVTRHTRLPAPSVTEVSTTSPPTSPPVGFRSITVAAPVPSRSIDPSTCSGSVEPCSARIVRGPRRSKARRSAPSRPTRRSSGFEEQIVTDPADHDVDPDSVPEIAEDKRSPSSRTLGVPLHHGQISADVRGQVDLVDDQQP